MRYACRLTTGPFVVHADTDDEARHLAALKLVEQLLQCDVVPVVKSVPSDIRQLALDLPRIE